MKRQEDELLRDVLAGDLSPDAAPVREAARRSAEFRARLRRLSRLAAELDETARDLRADLASGGPAPEVAATVADLRSRDARARARQRTLGRWLAAAAVLFALVVWGARALLVDGVSQGERAPVYLSGGTVELLAPIGPVEAYGEFRWRFELPARARYRVRVFDASEPGGEPVAESPLLDRPAWTLPPSETRSWPAHVRWEVHVLDAARTPLALGRGEASSRSR